MTNSQSEYPSISDDISTELTIVNWNIDSGGQEKRVLEELTKYHPDIIILTEFRQATESGEAIRNGLKHIGLDHFVSSRSDHKNGVLIASSSPIVEQAKPDSLNADHADLIAIGCTHGLKIVGVFCRNDVATSSIIEFLCSSTDNYLNDYSMLVGDFNFGPRSSDPRRYDKLQRLVDRKWVDFWRENYGDEIKDEYWTHKNKTYINEPDKGFSFVDHFFLSPKLFSLTRHSKKPINDQSVLGGRSKVIMGCSDHSLSVMWTKRIQV